MAEKKSFSGTPYARPPATPRQQLIRRESTSGSILKTLFSPAKWFTKSPKGNKTQNEDAGQDEEEQAVSEDDDDDGQDSAESISSQEDEEENVGLQSESTPMNQQRTPNTSKINSTPSSLASASNSQSPNSLLATFFSNKGDTPLTAVELEGVKAILARQTETGITNQEREQAPSYATPARRPYQPIFTPASMLPTTRAVTEVKKVRQGYTPSTTVASPFRVRNARSAFVTPRTPHPDQFATPVKYSLSTTIAGDSSTSEQGKRGLDEIAAPAPKRPRQASPEATKENSLDQGSVSTGNQTAASILEILDTEADMTIDDNSKAAQTPKRVLNPYSTSNSARRPANSVRKSPAKKEPRGALEEVARSEAIERKIPYQPKKSSRLANSFSAADDDDTSLFSPRRQIQSPAVKRSEQQLKAADISTPTKQGSKAGSLDTQVNKPALFDSTSSLKTQSTTPRFSFGASQESLRSSPATSSHTDIDVVPESSQADLSLAKRSNEPMPEASSSPAKPFSFGQFESTKSDAATIPSFTFGVPTPKVASEADSSASAASENVAATVSANNGEDVEDTRDESVVVHQLRDGTEYISPSKTQPKPSITASAEDKPKTPVFTFTSTHTKSSSSFNFSNYKEPAKDTPVIGGFVFDPTKATKTKSPEIKPIAQPVIEKPIERKADAKERALAVPLGELQHFDFTILPKLVPGDMQKKVLEARIMEISFKTKPSPAATKPAPVSSGGFNWEAAGMKKPESSGWTCEVCMVDNKSDATKCISCESKPPGKTVPSSVTNGASSAPPPAASPGVFNWAAAGLKAPAQQWSCSVCMTSNPDSAKACLACEAER